MDLSFLLAFPLLLALPTPCNACKCKMQHPQAIYCRSNVVMLLDILGVGRKFKNKQGFNVKVTKVFKGPLKAEQIHEIYSPVKLNACGFEMSTPTQNSLLVAGYLKAGKIHFTRCHLASLWAQLSLKQKLGFRLFYRKGCACRSVPCRDCSRKCPVPGVNDCIWQQRNCDFSYWTGDKTENYMCFPSKSGQCKWTAIPFNGTTIKPV